MDKDFNDFTDQLQLLNDTKKENIIEQLPAYNEANTNEFITNLKSELDQQKTINSILAANDEQLHKHIANVKKFSEKYTPVVEKQLAEIKQICSELKHVVAENKAMQESKKELNEIKHGEAYKKLAGYIKGIRECKEDIKIFLKAEGIVSPPLII